MSGDQKIPSSRLGRFARMATVGMRSGAGMLFGGNGSDGGAAHAAEVLGTLRGLAAKVGQMASYVDGVIPEAHQASYEAALKTLQAQAPRSSGPAMRARVEAELGAPIEHLFLHWQDEPIASASIGQVHLAQLLDGREVAVKVQHVGIEEAFESDLKNAGMLESVISMMGGRKLDVKAMLEEVRTRFREELDYQHEAMRLSQYARLHQGDSQIIVPEWFSSHSTKRVLTTAFMRGMTFEQAVLAQEEERAAWARTMWRFVFKAALHGGLIAADPHPGNYIFQPDGRVVFLDYGCIQPLDDQHRSRVLALHRTAIAGDERGFAEAAKLVVGTKPGALEVMAVKYMRRCFEPLFESPYRMTRNYAAALMAEMREMAKASLKAPPAEFFTLPPHMVFVNRLQFGFYSVLARLDVRVDFAAVERTFLSTPADLGLEAAHT
jgi:predicted unusual protein kinase regulating ubiquinone biosynthesis (AarF/ABC1/UbiB family)